MRNRDKIAIWIVIVSLLLHLTYVPVAAVTENTDVSGCWVETDVLASDTQVTVSYVADEISEMHHYTAWRKVIKIDEKGIETIVEQEEEIALEEGLLGRWQYQETFYREEQGEGRYMVTYYLMRSKDEKIEAKTYIFYIDAESPDVTVTCDMERKVTDEVVTCRLHMRETAPELCEVSFFVNRLSLSGEEDIELKGNDITACSDTEYVVQFGEEGVYSVWAEVTDGAGNKADTKDNPIVFTIDTSAPELSVLNLSTNCDPDGMSYNVPEELVLKLQIQDLCLGDMQEDSWVLIQKNDEEPKIYNLDWQAEISDEGRNEKVGNRVTGILRFSAQMEDAVYTLLFSAMDVAGNRAEKQIHFIIDRKAPYIGVQDVEVLYAEEQGGIPIVYEEGEGDVYYLNGNAEVRMRIEEANYENANVYVNTRRNEEQIEESVLPVKDRNDVLSVLYSEEGRYETRIQGKDAAGNVSEMRSVQYVIDKTAPVLSIGGAEEAYETRNPVLVTFAAQDENHNLSAYRINVTRSDVDGEIEKFEIKGEELTVYDAGDGWTTEKKQEDNQNESMIKRILRFEKDGHYDITFSGMDKSTNEALSQSITFCIDNTAPVITNVRYSESANIFRELQQNVYSNKGIIIYFEVQDQGVGINEQMIYVTVGKPKDRKAGTVKYMVSAGEECGEYVVRIPEDLNLKNLKNVITIWAEDKLGNETCGVSKNIVYSTKKPQIDIQSQMGDSKWSNGNVVLNATVTDEIAGLKKIVYKVNGKIVKNIEFDEVIYSYTEHIVAQDSADTKDGYTVAVEATNNCGTTDVKQNRVYIDKEKPVVVLSGVENGAHYNGKQIIRTEVKDISYENTKTVYYVTRTLDGKKEQISIPVFYSRMEEDACENVMTKQGYYEVYAVATDSAGNRSVSNTLSFVIDKTAPELTIAGIEENGMSNDSVSIQFGCKESFFETAHVTIQVKRNQDGDKSERTITEFPKDKKHSVSGEEFSEEGIYDVTISATDKAGNTALPQTLHFTVDKTAPEIQILGTESYQNFAEPVMIQLGIKELYYENIWVSIIGTRTDIDGNEEQIKLPGVENSGKISSVSQVFSDDGAYRLVVMAKDSAGNDARKEVHFTVDRSNPEITGIAQYDGNYYQTFQMLNSPDEMFRDLTMTTYRMLLNGVEYNGVDVVKQEGKYHLFVEVEDELGHKSVQEADFIVDSTAPEIVFTGVEDSDVVYEGGNVNLALKDEDDIITAVRMNGVECDASTRSLAYTEYGFYDIEVDCIDKAGNATTESISFQYRNPSEIPLIVALVILAITGIGVFGGLRIWNKRRKGAER